MGVLDTWNKKKIPLDGASTIFSLHTNVRMEYNQIPLSLFKLHVYSV